MMLPNTHFLSLRRLTRWQFAVWIGFIACWLAAPPSWAQVSGAIDGVVPDDLGLAELASVPALDAVVDFEDGRSAFLAGDAKQAESIWLSLVAQGGPQSIQAKYGLASLYEFGDRRVDEDPAAAAQLYGEACRGGIPDACTNLGVMYSLGRGVDQSETQAVLLWSAAAERGHCLAGFNLGLAYYSGRGIAMDRELAVENIFGAAECEVPEAEYAICQFYRLGLGVPENPGMALSYCQRASGNGNSSAQQIVGELVVAGVEPIDLSTVDRQGNPITPEVAQEQRIETEGVAPSGGDTPEANNDDDTSDDTSDDASDDADTDNNLAINEQATVTSAQPSNQAGDSASQRLAESDDQQAALRQAAIEAAKALAARRSGELEAAQQDSSSSPAQPQPPSPPSSPQPTISSAVSAGDQFENAASIMFQAPPIDDQSSQPPQSVMVLPDSSSGAAAGFDVNTGQRVNQSQTAQQSNARPSQSAETGTVAAVEAPVFGRSADNQQRVASAEDSVNCASVLAQCDDQQGFPNALAPIVEYTVEGQNIAEADLPVRAGFRPSARPLGVPGRSELLALWLGSGETREEAESIWAKVSPRLSTILTNPEPIYIIAIIPAEYLAEGETLAVTRVYIGPLPDEQTGWQVCNVLSLQAPETFCKPWDVNAI